MKDGERSGSFSARYNLVLVIFMAAVAFSLIIYILPVHFSPRGNPLQKVYFADNITPAHREIIRHFNEKYRGKVEIVPVDLPFSKFTTNERKELFARTLRNRNSRIDIFTVDQIWVPRFSKWAAPLSRYFSRRELARIIRPALATCYDGEVLVGIPLHIDIGVLYYRRDLLQALPDAALLERKLKRSLTWEEFFALRKRYDPRHPFYVFQGDNYEGLVLHFMEICGASLEGCIGQDSVNLQRPELLRSARLLTDLVRRAEVSPRQVTAFNESAAYRFALAEDAVFFRGWPGFLREAADYPGGPEKANLFGVAALPHFEGNPPVSAYGGWNLMISRHSSKKEEAALFLKYILSDEAQKILFETAGFLPVLQALYADSSYTQKYPNLTYFGERLEKGIYRPAHPEYTKMSGILSVWLHRALKGELTPEEALLSAEREINTRIFPAGDSY